MGNSWTIKKKDLENSNIYTNEYDAVNGKNQKNPNWDYWGDNGKELVVETYDFDTDGDGVDDKKAYLISEIQENGDKKAMGFTDKAPTEESEMDRITKQMYEDAQDLQKYSYIEEDKLGGYTRKYRSDKSGCEVWKDGKKVKFIGTDGVITEYDENGDKKSMIWPDGTQHEYTNLDNNYYKEYDIGGHLILEHNESGFTYTGGSNNPELENYISDDLLKFIKRNYSKCNIDDVEDIGVNVSNDGVKTLYLGDGLYANGRKDGGMTFYSEEKGGAPAIYYSDGTFVLQQKPGGRYFIYTQDENGHNEEFYLNLKDANCISYNGDKANPKFIVHQDGVTVVYDKHGNEIDYHLY